MSGLYMDGIFLGEAVEKLNSQQIMADHSGSHQGVNLNL